MKKNDISDFLHGCTINAPSGAAPGTGLTAIYKLALGISKITPKAEMLANLSSYYADEKNIIGIWEGLHKAERELIGSVVRHEGKEYVPSVREIADKYRLDHRVERWGRTDDILGDSYYSDYNYFKFLHVITRCFPGTKAVILFPGGRVMPPFILNALKEVVPPPEFNYGEYSPSGEDRVICRESRLGDFAALVRAAAGLGLKVKPGNLDLTKAKLVKLRDQIGYDEMCDGNGIFCLPKEVSKFSDFKVGSPMFALAAAASLLDIDGEGNISPGEDSPRLLSLPYERLAKELFEKYEQTRYIRELHYVSFITARDGDWSIDWPECRKPIIALLKDCPVGRFISFEEFDRYARIYCGDFFSELAGTVYIKGADFGYNGYYSYRDNRPEWLECESQIIRVILSFLSVLGMVDAVYSEGVTRLLSSDSYPHCVGITGFRITALGAYILGLGDGEYTAPALSGDHSSDGGLVVLPDFTVVISGLSSRIKHETYLSRYLTRISADENAAVYKIDFVSAVKAYDSELDPAGLKLYLREASDKPLPANVERTLDDWQSKAGRVKIRTLTLVETDDEFLLEELRHIKGMEKASIGAVSNAFSIRPETVKKAKTMIEKNGWLVDL